jgi:hypothetical protein
VVGVMATCELVNTKGTNGKDSSAWTRKNGIVAVVCMLREEALPKNSY